MARTKVYELAKELSISTKELMDKMSELGIPFKNHMSILSSNDANYLRKHYKKFAKTTGILGEGLATKKIIVRKRPKTERETEDSVEVTESPVLVEQNIETPQPQAIETLPPGLADRDDMVVSTTASEEGIGERRYGEEVLLENLMEEGDMVQDQEVSILGQPEEIGVPSAASSLEPQDVIGEAVERETTSEESPEIEETSMIFEEPPAQKEVLPLETFPEEMEPQEASEKLPLTESLLEPVDEVVETPVELTPEEDEESKRQKVKKHRKRRRKKPRKDEPAKIIQLPELIPPVEEEFVEEDLEAKVRGRIVEEEAKKIIKPSKRFRKREEKGVRDDLDEIPSKIFKPKKEERDDREEIEEILEKRVLLEKPLPMPGGTLPPKAGKRKIRIEEAIIVGDLAKAMGVKATEVIKKLLILGLPVTVNQAIDFDTASLVAVDFGYEVEKKGLEEEEILAQVEDKGEDLLPRPPVVTVMGHVDHGKTSLLDAIRHTNVTSEEAGGITQHIGAYHVRLDKGDIVFLDTPGHEAFTAMRARGAKVTDIVVLVVAADDGVMQQTIEAINHAKAAQVPILVAINKIDKPNANPDRVKRELSEQGLIPEEWGGNTVMVPVSAKKRSGIEDLLEMVLLQAEIMELKANPHKPARGRVIEAKLEKGRGPVATVLVQEGTLRLGDAFVCGMNYGKVRNIFDDRGQRIESAGPSMPVEVIGLSGVPQAGDDFAVVADEKQSRLLAEHRFRKQREREISFTTKVTLERLYEQIRQGELKELNIILKTDVQGSLEALSEAIKKLSHPDIKINIIHSATGAINETDVMLASASNAIVIGFNIRPDAKIEDLAMKEKVDLRFYNVIYQVIDDIKAAMTGLLEPEYREKVLGRAEVRQTFHISKIGTVGGCYVVDGLITRNARVRVLRDHVVLYDGKIGSLKRFKDDVREVKAGFECGMLIENFNDIKVGDVFEAYVMEEVKPSVESVSSQPEGENAERS